MLDGGVRGLKAPSHSSGVHGTVCVAVPPLTVHLIGHQMQADTDSASSGCHSTLFSEV